MCEELIEVYNKDTMSQIYELRVESWQSSGVNLDLGASRMWKDNYEEQARHWAIFKNNSLVAAARLSIHQTLEEVPSSYIFRGLKFDVIPPVASINRLVVHPSARGRGLSKKLDLVRLEAAKLSGCHTVVAYCLKQRIRSLEEQGFRCVSEIGFKIEPPFGAITALVLYF